MVEFKLNTLEELESNSNWEKIVEYDYVPQLYKKLENGKYFLYEVSSNKAIERKIYEMPILGFSIVESTQDIQKYYVFAKVR